MWPFGARLGIGGSVGGDHLAERLQVRLMGRHAVEAVHPLAPPQLRHGLAHVLGQEDEWGVQQLLDGELSVGAGRDLRSGVGGIAADHDPLQEHVGPVRSAHTCATGAAR